jgi:hypothetical protein
VLCIFAAGHGIPLLPLTPSVRGGDEIDTHNNTQSTRIEDLAMFCCEQLATGFAQIRARRSRPHGVGSLATRQ